MERCYLEDPDVDRRITLKWIFQKWIGSLWLKVETGDGRS